MMRKAFAASMTLAAAAVLAGCPTGTTANIPGMGGATTSPTTGATAAPNTSATTTPTTGAAACAPDAPTGTPVKGTAAMGDYNAQSLPQGWDVYKSEAEVTAAIKKFETGDVATWNCFQKFYSGAYTVYLRKK